MPSRPYTLVCEVCGLKFFAPHALHCCQACRSNRRRKRAVNHNSLTTKIVSLHQDGFRGSEIAKELGCTRQNVSFAIKKYKAQMNLAKE